jgi:hypothetical protein
VHKLLCWQVLDLGRGFRLIYVHQLCGRILPRRDGANSLHQLRGGKIYRRDRFFRLIVLQQLRCNHVLCGGVFVMHDGLPCWSLPTFVGLVGLQWLRGGQIFLGNRSDRIIHLRQLCLGYVLHRCVIVLHKLRRGHVLSDCCIGMLELCGRLLPIIGGLIGLHKLPRWQVFRHRRSRRLIYLQELRGRILRVVRRVNVLELRGRLLPAIH